MTCNRASEIQKYYDGELSLEQRTSVEAHVRDCADCAALLAELKGLSRLLLSVPFSEMRDGAVDRFQGTWNKASDRGILRVAGWLTAAAAAVLVAAVLNFNTPTTRAPVATTGTELEATPLMPPVEQARDEGRSDVVVLAQWISDDLGDGQQGGVR